MGRTWCRRVCKVVMIWALVMALAPQGWCAARWTVMVYMAADNDLEAELLDDFLEMAAVGSTDQVNVVVQLDRHPGYDTRFGNWTDCRRFYVTQGMVPSPDAACEDLGEVNMGDPQELVSFVDWAMERYPADRYVLILANHGGGWRSAPRITRDVCYDDTPYYNYDWLSTGEVRQALEGRHVDLLGFDACLMGMVEVAYELRGAATVMVASEEGEPAQGWPYEALLGDLVGDPDMDPVQLATAAVEEYGAFYASSPSIATLAAVDLAAVGDLVSQLDALAQTAQEDGSWYQVDQARRRSSLVDESSYCELGSFLEEISDSLAEAQSALDALEAAVLAIYPGDGSYGGMSIYFPLHGTFLDAAYGQLQLAQDTQWDEFLMAYLQADVSPEVSVQLTPSEATLSAGDQLELSVTVSGLPSESEGAVFYSITFPDGSTWWWTGAGGFIPWPRPCHVGPLNDGQFALYGEEGVFGTVTISEEVPSGTYTFTLLYLLGGPMGGSVYSGSATITVQ